MSGEAAFVAMTLGADHRRRSGLCASATSNLTCGAALVCVMSLKSMCQVPPDHCKAWSLTPTFGYARTGLVRADQSMLGGGLPTMQAWSCPGATVAADARGAPPPTDAAIPARVRAATPRRARRGMQPRYREHALGIRPRPRSDRCFSAIDPRT